MTSVDWKSIGGAAAISAVISIRAYRKGSLTAAGSMAAFAVGYVTASSGLLPFAALLTFFVSSTLITKVGKEQKYRIDAEYNPKGHRSAWQVLSNGGAATAVALGYQLASGHVLSPVLDTTNPLGRAIVLALVAHYAACQGDTWSSELGVLSPFKPRLITTGRVVPTGTNGGVSVVGTAASVAGGAILAAACSTVHYVYPTPGIEFARLWSLCAFASIGGSLIDSLLGATLQYSGQSEDGSITSEPGIGVRHISGVRVLSNNAVNFISSAAVLGATLWFALLP